MSDDGKTHRDESLSSSKAAVGYQRVSRKTSQGSRDREKDVDGRSDDLLRRLETAALRRRGCSDDAGVLVVEDRPAKDGKDVLDSLVVELDEEIAHFPRRHLELEN